MESVIAYLAHTFTINKFKVGLSVLFSWFSYLIGGFDAMIRALYVLLLMDFILGFMVAWKNANISKRKMQLGLVKLVTYSIAVIVFNFMNIATNGANIAGIGIRELGVAYLAITEGLSALRHLADLGVPLPMNLIKKIENFRDNLDK